MWSPWWTFCELQRTSGSVTISALISAPSSAATVWLLWFSGCAICQLEIQPRLRVHRCSIDAPLSQHFAQRRRNGPAASDDALRGLRAGLRTLRHNIHDKKASTSGKYVDGCKTHVLKSKPRNACCHESSKTRSDPQASLKSQIQVEESIQPENTFTSLTIRSRTATPKRLLVVGHELVSCPKMPRLADNTRGTCHATASR